MALCERFSTIKPLVEEIYQRPPAITRKFLVSGVDNPEQVIAAVLPDGLKKSGYERIEVTTLDPHSITYWVAECIPHKPKTEN